MNRKNQFLFRISALALLVLTVLLCMTACRTAPQMQELDMSSISLSQCTNTEEVTDHVRLNITFADANGNEQTGDVVIRLYKEVAPKTVANFQKLVKEDFYDGLTFHRVYPGFMIQGGDPNGDGTGGTTQIKGEMTGNGYENNLNHIRGVVSMARLDSYDSASCQFFIVHQTYSSLNHEYASFGYVVYGMDTVDAITETERTFQGRDSVETRPVTPVVINYATFVSVK